MSAPAAPSAPVEEVVLLDEDGRSLGTAPKATVHHEATPLHLAFSCYVFDASGERFLLTQRASAKPTFGGVWTNSACGHPAPGEPIADAVRRRVGQELGLVLERLTLVLPRFRYDAVVEHGPYAGFTENEMCPVFVATTSADPLPDPNEVEAWEWVEWDPFRASVLSGERAVSKWCREQVAELPARPLSAPPADPAELPPAAR